MLERPLLWPSLIVTVAISTLGIAAPAAASCPLAARATCLPPGPTRTLIATAAPTLPAAPVATPRVATQSELAQFAGQIKVPSFQWNERAVDGSYALVGYYTKNTGGTALFAQSSAGNWVLIKSTGGQITAGAMTQYVPSMPASVASALYSFAVSQDH